MFLFVIIAKPFLIARAAATVAFVVFSYSILFRVHEAVHVIFNLQLALRFVIILLPAALLKWFPCKSCAMYAASRSKSSSETFSTSMHPSGTARQGGYRRHFGRSLPSGFPTEILYTRWTLFSNLFFFLAFDFRRFSFLFFFPC